MPALKKEDIAFHLLGIKDQIHELMDAIQKQKKPKDGLMGAAKPKILEALKLAQDGVKYLNKYSPENTWLPKIIDKLEHFVGYISAAEATTDFFYVPDAVFKTIISDDLNYLAFDFHEAGSEVLGKLKDVAGCVLKTPPSDATAGELAYCQGVLKGSSGGNLYYVDEPHAKEAGLKKFGRVVDHKLGVHKLTASISPSETIPGKYTFDALYRESNMGNWKLRRKGVVKALKSQGVECEGELETYCKGDVTEAQLREIAAFMSDLLDVDLLHAACVVPATEYAANWAKELVAKHGEHTFKQVPYPAKSVGHSAHWEEEVCSKVSLAMSDEALVCAHDLGKRLDRHWELAVAGQKGTKREDDAVYVPQKELKAIADNLIAAGAGLTDCEIAKKVLEQTAGAFAMHLTKLKMYPPGKEKWGAEYYKLSEIESKTLDNILGSVRDALRNTLMQYIDDLNVYGGCYAKGTMDKLTTGLLDYCEGALLSPDGKLLAKVVESGGGIEHETSPGIKLVARFSRDKDELDTEFLLNWASRAFLFGEGLLIGGKCDELSPDSFRCSSKVPTKTADDIRQLAIGFSRMGVASTVGRPCTMVLKEKVSTVAKDARRNIRAYKEVPNKPYTLDQLITEVCKPAGAAIEALPEPLPVVAVPPPGLPEMIYKIYYTDKDGIPHKWRETKDLVYAKGAADDLVEKGPAVSAVVIDDAGQVLYETKPPAKPPEEQLWAVRAASYDEPLGAPYFWPTEAEALKSAEELLAVSWSMGVKVQVTAPDGKVILETSIPPKGVPEAPPPPTAQWLIKAGPYEGPLKDEFGADSWTDALSMAETMLESTKQGIWIAVYSPEGEQVFERKKLPETVPVPKPNWVVFAGPYHGVLFEWGAYDSSTQAMEAAAAALAALPAGPGKSVKIWSRAAHKYSWGKDVPPKFGVPPPPAAELKPIAARLKPPAPAIDIEGECYKMTEEMAQVLATIEHEMGIFPGLTDESQVERCGSWTVLKSQTTDKKIQVAGLVGKAKPGTEAGSCASAMKASVVALDTVKGAVNKYCKGKV